MCAKYFSNKLPVSAIDEIELLFDSCGHKLLVEANSVDVSR